MYTDRKVLISELEQAALKGHLSDGASAQLGAQISQHSSVDPLDTIGCQQNSLASIPGRRHLGLSLVNLVQSA